MMAPPLHTLALTMGGVFYAVTAIMFLIITAKAAWHRFWSAGAALAAVYSALIALPLLWLA